MNAQQTNEQYKVQLPGEKGVSPLECLVNSIATSHPEWKRLEIAQLLGLDRDTVSKAMRVNIEEDGGFTTVPSELLFQGLRPGEILLASVLMNLEGNSGHARPSNNSLSIMLDTSVSSLQRWKSKLKKKGLLETKQRFRDGWQLSNDHIISAAPFIHRVHESLKTLKYFERQKWVKRHYYDKTLNSFIRRRTKDYQNWIANENMKSKKANPFSILTSKVGNQLTKEELGKLRTALKPGDKKKFDEALGDKKLNHNKGRDSSAA